jgi:hypothetical protein
MSASLCDDEPGECTTIADASQQVRPTATQLPHLPNDRMKQAHHGAGMHSGTAPHDGGSAACMSLLPPAYCGTFGGALAVVTAHYCCWWVQHTV